MNKKLNILTFVTVLLFSGCVTDKYLNNKTVSNGEPQWLLDPYIDGDEIAAVGCSLIHFDGKEAQKKLAISRAIDQIATQKRVKVENVKLRRRSVNGINKSSSMDSSSLQSVDGVLVSTKTKAIYTKKNGEICAWVILR